MSYTFYENSPGNSEVAKHGHTLGQVYQGGDGKWFAVAKGGFAMPGSFKTREAAARALAEN